MSQQHQRDLEQHKECMKTIAELETCLEGSGGSDWVARFQTCFGQFRTALRAHFEFEEGSQFYGNLSVKEPRLAGRIEKLRVEHGEILHETDQVTQQIDSLKAGTPAVAELKRRAERLVTRLRHHEAAEAELLQTAHLREVGAGD